MKLHQQVVNPFSGGTYGGSDDFADEPDLMLHQKLERLYASTRAAKPFQRDVVHGVEGYIVSGSKQVEIGNKLSEDGRKYGIENSGSTLSKAALNFSQAQVQIEKERGDLLESFGTQVAEPLREMVMGAPLDDARHLAQSYDRLRHEVKSQAAEVYKRQERTREGPGSSDLFKKLEVMESKLQHSKCNMLILGNQATSAMATIEAQQ